MFAIRAQNANSSPLRTQSSNSWAPSLVSLRASQRPNDSPRAPQRAKRTPESLYDGPKAPKVAIRSHFGASLEPPGLKTIKNTSDFACFHVALKMHHGRVVGDPGVPQALKSQTSGYRSQP